MPRIADSSVSGLGHTAVTTTGPTKATATLSVTPAEMLGQFFTIQHEHAVPPERMNVVFMGMGEPLLNLENLTTTLDVLYATVAPKRITVSTSGIIPGIDDLAKLERRPNLAISINAPDRRRRMGSDYATPPTRR